jgi:protein SHQ1
MRLSDLLSTTQNRNIYLTLVTFLFSYAYEARSTQLDFNSESAWTICTLNAATAALDPPPYGIQVAPDSSDMSQHFSRNELLATLIPCYRRSLAFPLYRSFVFAESCHADVANLLLKGQRTVIRCFLDMKRILDHHEVYYVYSKIWVDDICVWLQTSAG